MKILIKILSPSLLLLCSCVMSNVNNTSETIDCYAHICISKTDSLMKQKIVINFSSKSGRGSIIYDNKYFSESIDFSRSDIMFNEFLKLNLLLNAEFNNRCLDHNLEAGLDFDEISIDVVKQNGIKDAIFLTGRCSGEYRSLSRISIVFEKLCSDLKKKGHNYNFK